jgi:hypothetical protein
MPVANQKEKENIRLQTIAAQFNVVLLLLTTFNA